MSGYGARPRQYAALDLGTNNCRLLIARVQGDGFTVIDAFSRIVRLGVGLERTGRISEAAIDRTIAALAVCTDKLRHRPITPPRSSATAACLRTATGPKFNPTGSAHTRNMSDIIPPPEATTLHPPPP